MPAKTDFAQRNRTHAGWPGRSLFQPRFTRAKINKFEGKTPLSARQPRTRLRYRKALPVAFYFRATNNDWTTPQNADLWRDGIKTLFDSCPAGWRVPKSKDKGAENLWNAFTAANGPWKEITATITGRLFGTAVVHGGTAWYSTSGRRSPNAYFSVYGTHGQLWTTSVAGGIGYIFNISVASVNLDITNHARAYAFPVRCVRE